MFRSGVAMLGLAIGMSVLSSGEAKAQSGTITLSGTFNGTVYNRTNPSLKYVTQGQFKVTVVATRYTYQNGSLQISDGLIYLNGPFSTVLNLQSGALYSGGGTISSRQTAYQRGMVNQLTIRSSNLAPTLRITAFSLAYNQYVVR